MTHINEKSVRRQLEKVRDEALHRYRATRDSLAEEVSRRNIGDALEDIDREVAATVSAGQLDADQRLIRSVDIALKRLAAGMYGICFDCRKPIPHRRLKANPLATRCLACQEETEAQSGSAHTVTPFYTEA
ncbi:MAG: TraR/DksA family transcriptional regulator [Candidatus Yanofskybacteria bacterium]|nr:TraR/DksA family transcriptional regulator [Candidatus Yanofskybacteria bacterium]